MDIFQSIDISFVEKLLNLSLLFTFARLARPKYPLCSGRHWQRRCSPIRRPLSRRTCLTQLCLTNNTQLADLVTDDSWLIFQLLQLDPRSWLEQSVSEWERDAGFTVFRDFVWQQSECHVNDVAERGVAMIETFANTVTHDEDDLQWLLQAVENHRKRVTGFSKSELSAL